MNDTSRREYEPGIAARADAIGRAVNYLTERVIAALIVLMVMDVGVGIVFRYGFGSPPSWTEELARYLMIWGALLAISACVARREHIGFTLLFDRRRSRAGGISWLSSMSSLSLSSPSSWSTAPISRRPS